MAIDIRVVGTPAEVAAFEAWLRSHTSVGSTRTFTRRREPGRVGAYLNTVAVPTQTPASSPAPSPASAPPPPGVTSGPLPDAVPLEIPTPDQGTSD